MNDRAFRLGMERKNNWAVQRLSTPWMKRQSFDEWIQLLNKHCVPLVQLNLSLKSSVRGSLVI